MGGINARNEQNFVNLIVEMWLAEWWSNRRVAHCDSISARAGMDSPLVVKGDGLTIGLILIFSSMLKFEVTIATISATIDEYNRNFMMDYNLGRYRKYGQTFARH